MPYAVRTSRKWHAPSPLQGAALPDPFNALLIEGGALPPYNDGIHPDGCHPLLRRDSGSWTEVNPNSGIPGYFRACCYYVPPGAPYRASRMLIHGNIDCVPSLSMAYNPVTDTYDNTLTPLPTAVGGNSTFGAYGNGLGWVVGGQREDFAPSDRVQTFDLNPANGAPWTTLGTGCRLPTAVGQVMGFTDPATGLIYCGGGTLNPEQDAPASITCVTDWGVIDPVAGTYTPLTPLPFALAQGAGACLGGKGYIVGGSRTRALSGTTGVLRYNIAANTWTVMGAFPFPTSAGVACFLHGVMLAGAGWNATGFTDTESNNTSPLICQYDEGADSWTLHSTLPVSVAASMMAAVVA